MLRLLIIISCYLIHSSLNSQSEIRTTTTITEAKIFLKGANLKRTATVELPAGKTTIVIEKLPTDVNFTTVKLNFGDDVEIQNISERINYLKKLDSPEATLALKRKRDSLAKEIRYLELDGRLTDDKITLITNNATLKSTDGRTKGAEVKEYLSLYNNELTELRREELDLTIKLKNLKDERDMYIKELRNIEGIKDEPSLEIVVEVIAERSMNTPLILEYYTPNAAWFPKYNVRVDDVTRPLNLSLKALVTQSTAETWKDVNIILSNVQPDFEGSMPVLEKWELTYKRLTRVRSNFGNVNVDQVSGRVIDTNGEALIGATVSIQGTTVGTTTDLDGYYELSVPKGAKSLVVNYVGYESQIENINRKRIDVRLEEGMILEEVVVTGYASDDASSLNIRGMSREKVSSPQLATVSEKFNAVEYTIIEKQTIGNEGLSKMIDVQEYILNASYEHHAIPKLKPDVYIQAMVADWDNYYFLNGEMNIYFENSYVGKSLLETNVFSDTLFLSLGKDFNVSVDRNPVKSTSKKQFLGSNKVVTKSFEINVKNLKQQPVELFIHDQIPVSIINSVDVELLESGNADLDTTTGELSWRKQLPAKANDTFNFTYKVKFPKGEEVILE